MSELGITVKKSENISEWYTQVVLKSELADYAPVHGCIVLRDYSYAIWENIQKYFDEKIKELGHKNVYFPCLIPESLLAKETEHFKGFKPECAWVTVGGNDVLNERLAIRPTSETIIYALLQKWIRSWRDLPIKINQWCNIIRWEIKSTKPFLRTTEFLWQEGHTAHENLEDAEKEVFDILKIYHELMEDLLSIPVLLGRKSEREKFAGAYYTLTLEAIMPDGKALQMGTVHNLGQNFSKVFDIKFLGKDGKYHYVWTTSWGISTRLIGALIMVHGDDKGLIIPPKVAPYQVVIVPIFYKVEERENVLKVAHELKVNLIKEKIRAILDDREWYTPGWKFNEWELKGVPLRIEIGPRDLKEKTITLVRRDTGERIAVKFEDAINEIKSTLDKIHSYLYNKAKKFLEGSILTVKNYDEFKEAIAKGGFIRACWCLKNECEEKIKDETGATIRLIPLNKEEVFSKCIYCNEDAREVVYFAKAY